MNIVFKNISIQNFRSIEKADVDLENQGIVIVKGINEYEDKASSNGSGKSSIFEAIIYALFEETSSGEKNVSNRITNNGHCVILDLEIDNIKYKIIRECKGTKTSVLLYKDDVDISARNKTDTNKLIESILGISKNIFLDSVFLSQNANTNLTSLSPTARKERLEILVNTDSMINTFKEQLKQKQTEYKTQYTSIQSETSVLQGQKQVYESQCNEYQTKLNEIEEQIRQRDMLGNVDEIDLEIKQNEQKLLDFDKDIELKTQEIENQESLITETKNNGNNNLLKKDEINTALNNKVTEYNQLQSDINGINIQIENLNKENIRLENEVKKIQNSDRCPTCGRKYDNTNEEHIQNAINELRTLQNENINKIQEFENNKENLLKQATEKETEGKTIKIQLQEIDVEIQKHNDTVNELETKRRQLNNDKTLLQNNKNLIQNNINALQNKKQQILSFKVGNKEEVINAQKEVTDKLNNIQEELNQQVTKQTEVNSYLEAVNHMLQLVTKEFRTFLLKNSIAYINKLLEGYSQKLFSNSKDVIQIQEDDVKLNITLGDATYESLSGGEKTRVNIALLLAQKSLSSVIGNVSCNMIILDEILGYCDTQAELNVVDLLTQELSTLETIFMVSHKEIPIGYDKELIVIKDKTGLSKIKSM